MSLFSEKLMQLRRQCGISQERLATDLGLVKSTISMYEKDKRKPSFEVLKSLSDYFHVSTEELMRGEDCSCSDTDEEVLSLFRRLSVEQKEEELTYLRKLVFGLGK